MSKRLHSPPLRAGMDRVGLQGECDVRLAAQQQGQGKQTQGGTVEFKAGTTRRTRAAPATAITTDAMRVQAPAIGDHGKARQ